jgi:hypothetical protein
MSGRHFRDTSVDRDADLTGPGMFLIVGLCGLYLGMTSYVQELRQYRELDASHAVTAATVIARAVPWSWDPGDTTYEITYEFTLGESRYTNTVTVHGSTFRALREGSTVNVVYVPGDATISTLEEVLRPPEALLRFVFFVALACGCVWALITFCRGLVQEPW